MTQEEKQLLLIDLSARLSYGVKIQTWYGEIITSDLNTFPYSTEEMDKEGMWNQLNNFKPYLRPMSSMTEEEKKELKEATCPEGTGYFDENYLICPMNHFGELISYKFMSSILNWLNAHYFDYNGLIEKGLALEAPEEMYKTE